MPLDQNSLVQARNYLNQQYNTSGSPWDFASGDFASAYQSGANNAQGIGGMGFDILGAAQALGWGDADIAQVLGVSESAIPSIRARFSPDSISAQGRTFMHDTGLGNSSLVQDQYHTVRNDDGTYTTTDRTSGQQVDIYGNPIQPQVATDPVPPPAPGPAPAPAPGMLPAAPPGGAISGMPGGLQPNDSPNYFSYTPNPMMMMQAQNLADVVTNNLQRKVLPGIGDQFQAAGGYGDSGWGNATGMAIGETNRGLTDALANMLGQDYTGAMNRGLTQYQADQGYDVNLGRLGLENQNSLQGFYGQQRAQDSGDRSQGASLYEAGNQGYLSQGQGMFNIGNTMNNAAWQPISHLNDIFTPYATGFPTSTSSSNYGGGPMGMFGGAGAGYQFGHALQGGWGSGNSNWVGGGGGFGTGANFGNQDYGQYF